MEGGLDLDGSGKQTLMFLSTLRLPHHTPIPMNKDTVHRYHFPGGTQHSVPGGDPGIDRIFSASCGIFDCLFILFYFVLTTKTKGYFEMTVKGRAESGEWGGARTSPEKQDRLRLANPRDPQQLQRLLWHRRETGGPCANQPVDHVEGARDTAHLQLAAVWLASLCSVHIASVLPLVGVNTSINQAPLHQWMPQSQPDGHQQCPCPPPRGVHA